METITTQGTSVEVLTPYLPYGLKLQSAFNDGTEEYRAKLMGIETFSTYCLHVVFDDNQRGVVSAKHWRPLLRPFSALCDPLPDGKIPACELANREYERAGISTRTTIARYVDDERIRSMVLVYRDNYSQYCASFTESEFVAGNVPLWMAQLLYKWGFAVGLKESDYLPLAPATPAAGAAGESAAL